MSRTEIIDRLPPHAAEAEAGVLSCALQDSAACLGEVVSRFKSAEPFYDQRHQEIYAVMLTLWDAHKSIDVITVQQELKTRGRLKEVGDIEYLSNLANLVPSPAHLPDYLGLVFEAWLQRRMLRALTDSTALIYQPNASIPETLDKIEGLVLAVNEGIGQSEQRDMKQLVTDTTVMLDDKLRRGVGFITGIRTHFGYLDKMLGGLHRKELGVLAARPSLGKTSFMLNIARNVAVQEKIPVGIFSMEMSADDLTLRLMCAEAQVDFHKLRTGFSHTEDVPKLAAVAPQVAFWPMHIDDTPALGILELRARARRMANRWGCELFLVDYLQLMHGSRDYNGNRALEVAEISGGLKSLAKELNAALLVLSQLNRELEKQKSRKPQLADLRESGAIEQDADMVAMLYRPKSETPDVKDEDLVEIPVNALIAKQRNGPTGDCKMIFCRPFMQMKDAFDNKGKML